MKILIFSSSLSSSYYSYSTSFYYSSFSASAVILLNFTNFEIQLWLQSLGDNISILIVFEVRTIIGFTLKIERVIFNRRSNQFVVMEYSLY
jgi:hypothetical protein